MSKERCTLIISRFGDRRPDILLLQQFEQACLAKSAWRGRPGPLLFRPAKISTRFYTFLHTCLRPLRRLIRINRCVISLGLPYRHYFFGKTFPYFTFDSALRVLWTYDVWETQLEEISRIAKEARLDVLLVSSRAAAERLSEMVDDCCDVHWVPEAIEVSDYARRPWQEREIDVLSFGRTHSRYHAAIRTECEVRGIRYVFQRFASAAELVAALGNARISICFPRAVTHPQGTGKISTVTLRYLESMASKCLIVGSSPADAQEMFGYNPVVEVDWADPAGQLQRLLQNPSEAQELIERNFAAVKQNHQTCNFVQRVEELIGARLATC